MKNKEICEKGMKFEECELAIIRTAVDKAEKIQGSKVVNTPEIKRMITIVENFIRKNQLIVYGGFAIDAILPAQDKFYNKETELSDYDFFSPNAMEDAKELADIYLKEGFTEVESKSGQHHGTYKTFVDFLGIADITYIHKDIFNKLREGAIKINGIYYAPPDFLRMSMYLELSRPAGDVSRWEKVAKRLALLNKNYPLHEKHCDTMNFQRGLTKKTDETLLFDTVKNTFVEQGVIFFGGYAMSMYSKYMPKRLQAKFKKVADFDVLSEDPVVTSTILKERLHDEGFTKVKIKKRESIGEIVAPHYQIMVGSDTVAFIYSPVACHSYNKINVHGQELKIATIDTMLSFYLAFLYSGRNYYNNDRIICMSQFLFEVQQQNRLSQKGLLKRFSISCYGHQETVEEMRAQKAKKYEELKNKRNSEEYNEYFLRYRPGEKLIDKTKAALTKKPTPKTTTKTKITKTTKTKPTQKKTSTKKRGRGGLFH